MATVTERAQGMQGQGLVIAQLTLSNSIGLSLQKIQQNEPPLCHNMDFHYSHPKGFVGRNICYAVMVGNVCYGSIVGGSATKFLPGRNEFFDSAPLNNIVNNIFFHIEKHDGEYPFREFSVKVLQQFRKAIQRDWSDKYGDRVVGFESLVELPRTGECYRRDGWTVVGQTKGFTCKRIAGLGTDSWSGRRVWDTENLRPKLVFTRLP